LRDDAGGAGLKLVERPFTVAEAKRAAEAFLTSTTSAAMPVVKIDGTPVGDGKPGPVSRRLLQLLEHDGDGL
jgi:D-alanine transaminase